MTGRCCPCGHGWNSGRIAVSKIVGCAACTGEVIHVVVGVNYRIGRGIIQHVFNSRTRFCNVKYIISKLEIGACAAQIHSINNRCTRGKLVVKVEGVVVNTSGIGCKQIQACPYATNRVEVVNCVVRDYKRLVQRTNRRGRINCVLAVGTYGCRTLGIVDAIGFNARSQLATQEVNAVKSGLGTKSACTVDYVVFNQQVVLPAGIDAV